MTDSNWQKKINDCVKLITAHKIILRECEQEYERHFGINPSDIDDNWWIDTLHCGNGSTDLNKIIESAEMHAEMHSDMIG